MVDGLTWVLNLRDYNLFNMASRLMSNLEYIMGVKIGYSERADVDWSWVYETGNKNSAVPFWNSRFVTDFREAVPLNTVLER